MEEPLIYLDSIKSKSLSLELDKSAIAGLKKMPVDMFDGIYLGEDFNHSLILCVDVRNFSDFLCSQKKTTVFKLIKEFTSNLLSCINQFGYGCSYYKLMGDGALIIWDQTSQTTINEALEVFDTYTDFLNNDLFKPFDRLGLGGALVEEEVFKYEISAEVSQIKYRDYVGYGINLACRLQALAGPNQLVLNELLAGSELIPFRVDKSSERLKELRSLKGLKSEDRHQVLFYDKDSQ